jgi:hypothetical protein
MGETRIIPEMVGGRQPESIVNKHSISLILTVSITCCVVEWYIKLTVYTTNILYVVKHNTSDIISMQKLGSWWKLSILVWNIFYILF